MPALSTKVLTCGSTLCPLCNFDRIGHPNAHPCVGRCCCSVPYCTTLIKASSFRGSTTLTATDFAQLYPDGERGASHDLFSVIYLTPSCDPQVSGILSFNLVSSSFSNVVSSVVPTVSTASLSLDSYPLQCMLQWRLPTQVLFSVLLPLLTIALIVAFFIVRTTYVRVLLGNWPLSRVLLMPTKVGRKHGSQGSDGADAGTETANLNPSVVSSFHDVKDRRVAKKKNDISSKGGPLVSYRNDSMSSKENSEPIADTESPISHAATAGRKRLQQRTGLKMIKQVSFRELLSYYMFMAQSVSVVLIFLLYMPVSRAALSVLEVVPFAIGERRFLVQDATIAVGDKEHWVRETAQPVVQSCREYYAFYMCLFITGPDGRVFAGNRDMEYRFSYLPLCHPLPKAPPSLSS